MINVNTLRKKKLGRAYFREGNLLLLKSDRLLFEETPRQVRTSSRCGRLALGPRNYVRSKPTSRLEARTSVMTSGAFQSAVGVFPLIGSWHQDLRVPIALPSYRGHQTVRFWR